MEDFIIKLERIGSINPTTVYHEDRVLTTQGLSIKQLCELWKWYYAIPPYCRIVLRVSEQDYKAMGQRPLSDCHSVRELFEENHIRVEEEKDDFIPNADGSNLF